MKKRIINILILTFDLIFIIMAATNILLLYEKPAIPAELNSKNFIISSEDDKLIKGMQITAIIDSKDNQFKVENKHELEYILDLYKIGDRLDLFTYLEGSSAYVQVKLVHYYSLFFIIVVIIVGALFIFSGIYLFLRQKGLPVSGTFHWLMLSVAGMIVFTWGSLSYYSETLHFILRSLFDVSVFFVPPLFIHLSFQIPHEKWKNRKALMIPLYFISSLASIYLIFFESKIIFNAIDLISFNRYYFVVGTIGDIYLIAGLLFVVINLIHSAFTQKEESDRKKLSWIFVGFSFGPLIYVFLYLLPRQIIGTEIIPESVMLLTIGVAPITLFMSIVKYRFLDIELVIKRGTIYFIVIVILLSIYIAVVTLVSNYLMEYSYLPGIIAAILIAIMFQPLKSKVQNAVDKRFFKINYNFRIAQNEFTRGQRLAISEEEIISHLKSSIMSIIPVRSFGFFHYNNMEKKFIVDEHNLNTLKKNSSIIINDIKNNDKNMPLSLENVCENDVEFQSLKNENHYNGIKIVFNYRSQDRSIISALLLSEKLSGFPYTLEDTEILQLFLIQTSESINNIRIRKNLLFQKEENEKLTELSNMKSYFVSSVSHELKTPLTSIRMFAELMQIQKSLPLDKVNHYLMVIIGECDRLNRLINNILDFSKIEKGIKEYEKENIDLKELLEKVIATMEYQIKIQKFEFEYVHSYGDYQLYADPDALSEVFINLINNAMKYSDKNKHLKIELGMHDNQYYIAFVDKGIGISIEDQSKIFEAFYRSKNENASKTGGTGIGLSLVNSIVKAHGGKIELDSELNKGSNFTIFIPKKEKQNEKNCHYRR